MFVRAAGVLSRSANALSAASARSKSVLTPAAVQLDAGTSELGGMIDNMRALADKADKKKTSKAASRTKSDRFTFRPLPLDSVYAPKDLAFARRVFKRPSRQKSSAMGPSAKVSKASDAFRVLGIDPLRECNNYILMSYFTSEMGKILSRSRTGLSWRSQRKVGKAVRRAQNMGVIPLFSRHPALFRRRENYTHSSLHKAVT